MRPEIVYPDWVSALFDTDMAVKCAWGWLSVKPNKEVQVSSKSRSLELTESANIAPPQMH